MTYNLIFPEIYFKYENENHQDSKNYIINELVEKNNFSVNKDWNCNSKTFHIQNNLSIQFISSALDKFSKENKKNSQLFVNESWINLYDRGSFQEVHSHPLSQFVLVYFVQYQKDTDAKFYFYNSNDKILETTGVRNFYSDDINSRVAGRCNYPDIEEGDIIIFPGYLDHGVSPHNSDSKRITLSCNFNFS